MSANSKTFAFIESNTTGSGRSFLRAAMEMGYRVEWLIRDPSKYEFLDSELIHPTIIDTTDSRQMIQHLKSVDDLVGVFSTSDYFIVEACRVAAALGLAANAVEAVERCRDKYLFSIALQSAEVRSPHTSLLRHPGELDNVLGPLPFPVVIKPVQASGSIGVRRCGDRAACDSHLQKLHETGLWTFGSDLPLPVLIQQYIPGDEYSVETISADSKHHVLGITRKHLGPLPYFVEMGHDFPAALSAEQAALVSNAALAALDAVGFRFGPAHTEVRLHDDKAYVIETNARLAGGMIPELIRRAGVADPITLIIELYATGQQSLHLDKLAPTSTASIRFVVPDAPGHILDLGVRTGLEVEDDVDIAFLKRRGDFVEMNGDFKDRAGYLIATGECAEKNSERIELARQHVSLVMGDAVPAPHRAHSSIDTGRLKSSLLQEAQQYLQEEPPASEDRTYFHDLAAIDEAHLLMLHEVGVLSTDIVRQILGVIRELRKTGFRDLLNAPARDNYFRYEDTLVGRLGIEVGGAAPTAKSRNDINATLFVLKTRRHFQDVFQSCWRLRSELLSQAERYQHLDLPIYSQFQPALPGTYGYYLLAVEESLSRDQQQLMDLSSLLEVSPLGSGAGTGTTFPINPAISAAYLGFSRTSRNALDGVASRDLAIRLLGVLIAASITISRVAQDYQLWLTREFNFFDLPDSLAGASSMMPHKKNPYLLERIKGMAARLGGYFAGAVAAMQKSPFSNSVEVGTEALADYEASFRLIRQSAGLLRLMIRHLKPLPENIQTSLREGLVMSAAIADRLVLDGGLSFRAAHRKLGEVIRDAIRDNVDPFTALMQFYPPGNEDHALGFDWKNLYQFGGGPGDQSRELRQQKQRLIGQATWYYQQRSRWSHADNTRTNAIDSLLDQRTTQRTCSESAVNGAPAICRLNPPLAYGDGHNTSGRGTLR